MDEWLDRFATRLLKLKRQHTFASARDLGRRLWPALKQLSPEETAQLISDDLEAIARRSTPTGHRVPLRSLV